MTKSNKGTKRFKTQGPVEKINDHQEFGVQGAKDRNEQIAMILDAQTRFAQMDAGEVAGYMIVIVHATPDENGDLETIVEAAGNTDDKLRMLDTIVDALEHQLGTKLRAEEPTIAGHTLSELFGLGPKDHNDRFGQGEKEDDEK